MDWLDDKPAPKGQMLGQVLDAFSIEDLDEYTAALEAEIARVAAERDKKRTQRDAAASIFKS